MHREASEGVKPERGWECVKQSDLCFERTQSGVERKLLGAKWGNYQTAAAIVQVPAIVPGSDSRVRGWQRWSDAG